MKTRLIVPMLMLLATPAFAQTDAPLRELTDGQASVAQLGSTVDQTIGMEVIDEERNILAEVTNVLGEDADTPTAVVIKLENGGMVVLELAEVQIISNQIVVPMKQAQLAQLPQWPGGQISSPQP